MEDADALVPADKFDTAAADRVAAADTPAIAAVANALVDWCLDSNWPVAQALGPVLGRRGGPVIAPVRAVLDGTDAAAKYHVLVGVVGEMPPEIRQDLRPSLAALVHEPGDDDAAEELPELAAGLLAGLDPGLGSALPARVRSLTDEEPDTWSVGTSEEEARAATAAEVADALHAVAAAWSAKLPATAAHATFYAWHDEMAGNLRVSLALCPPDQLPFRAPVRLTRDAGDVVEPFLASRYLEGIPWEDLGDVDVDADVPAPPRPELTVFVAPLRPPATAG